MSEKQAEKIYDELLNGSNIDEQQSSKLSALTLELNTLTLQLNTINSIISFCGNNPARAECKNGQIEQRLILLSQKNIITMQIDEIVNQ